MRLTLPLFLFKLPNGHLFKGKNRLVQKVTKKAVALLKEDLAIEEKNMFYLRHPFLTREQSYNHTKGLDKRREFFKQFVYMRNKKFSNDRTLKDELSHLKTSEQWEFKAGSN